MADTLDGVPVFKTVQYIVDQSGNFEKAQIITKYYGASTETKPSTNLVDGDVFVETDTKKEYEWNGSSWTLVKQTTNGSAHVTIDGVVNLGESNIRTAWATAGAGAGVVPNSDLSTVPASADIIAWTFTAGKKNASLLVEIDKVAGNTYLGWWVTINAGSAVAALTRLQEALGTATGAEVSVYAAGATIDADENKASYIVGASGLEITTGIDGDDITDMYVMPVTSAATAVGSQILTAIVS